MADKHTDAYGAPPVIDKRAAPPGSLPKNANAWLISVLAAVMVVAIWVSGGKTPKDKPAAPAVTNTVIDPNALRIQEYKKRLEEETRKLESEQAQLARQEQALEATTTGAAINRASLTGGERETTYARSEAGGIRAEKEKREYESLFASNVALTFRQDVGTAAKEPPRQPDEWSKMLSFYSAMAALQGSPRAAGPVAPAATAPPETSLNAALPDSTIDTAEAAKPIAKAPQRNRQAHPAEGKAYRLMEGTIFETVLANRLDGSFSGPVNCLVSANIYSHDGRHLLIPQGSRVLGEVRKLETFGQQRLAVTFHRLIMPDHYSIDLDKFQGLNQIGETGLRDQVNHHYLQVFGVSLAIGAIAGLGESNTRTGFDRSALDAYEEGIATSLSQSSLRILDRYLNVLPTFTIREGHRVKIFLSEDLWLPAYDQHPLSND